MKTPHVLIAITIFMIVSVFAGFCQKIDSLNTNYSNDSVQIKTYTLPEIFTTDKNLKLIAQHIPQNWYVIYASDTMTFFNISPIYKVSTHEMADTLRKGRGKMKELAPQPKDSVRIKFLLQPLWSGSKVDEAKFQNSHTLAMIEKLPKKYKITHLMDIITKEDFDLNTAQLTENERKSVKKYLDEKRQLESQIIITPDYHTSEFSLFLIEVYPSTKERHLFIPPGIMAEIDVIIELFNKFAGK